METIWIIIVLALLIIALLGAFIPVLPSITVGWVGILILYLVSDDAVSGNTMKVIRARLIFHKATGARIEIFCLEPHVPADYERAFAAHDRCRWQCIVGNLKKWKDGPLQIAFGLGGRA